MAYPRLSSPSNDNRPTETWGQRRYGVMPPPPRRRGGALLLGLIVMPMGVWGLWLLLGTPIPPPAPAPAPEPRPLVFQVEHPALPDGGEPGFTPRLTIVLNHEPPPSNHPETWGALPTAVTAPVVAAPLADASPALDDTAGCRDAATLAAQMTCIDPALREADLRMAAAYDAVLAAGVSPADLGRSQARWLTTRDEAAKASPEDLLAAYQLRESQLRSFAVAVERQAGSVGRGNGAS
uniref:Uncharacterized membrane-bound protein n=1 Tax=Caulobacter sp. (strain K31) TaxID=366602 RepID=B0T0W4_CAUSK